EAGAAAVHMRISCPPTVSPCYYGVDTPRKADLIAAQMSVDEVCRYIEADSLGYLSLTGMLEAIGFQANSACVACWNGNYPTPVADGQPTIDNS
nr:amidophosphoribosyltransferase [Acidobacteriota bacterium]